MYMNLKEEEAVPKPKQSRELKGKRSVIVSNTKLFTYERCTVPCTDRSPIRRDLLPLLPPSQTPTSATAEPHHRATPPSHTTEPHYRATPPSHTAELHHRERKRQATYVEQILHKSQMRNPLLAVAQVLYELLPFCSTDPGY